ncbi:magnesium transporter, partial [Synergistaceae bacterium OttesenSCG-928-I11]|nr:magnesium transporter [Synergistaceae bacterium OttesenSCG-928-I11]
LLYPDDSAGSIMTAEFTDLRADMTVGEAIDHLRAVGENRETIYTCYVIDALGRLEGVVSVKDLLLSHDAEIVQEIMSPDVISVFTTSGREEAAQLVAKYDLISLPVMDAERHLVGIVTIDDAMDAMQEEATEDFEKMAAITPSERPYLKTGIATLARNRLPWLLLLMLSGMLTGTILGFYEPVYAAVPVLVTFIPMLTGTGGNAGSQASTMVIRGIALGEIDTGDALKVVWKEARVSVVVGAALATMNYVRLTVTHPDGGFVQLVPLVVSLAQFGAIVVAQTLGGLLPIAASALRVDPAIMAAPLITSIADALTLVLYFSVAASMLF